VAFLLPYSHQKMSRITPVFGSPKQLEKEHPLTLANAGVFIFRPGQSTPIEPLSECPWPDFNYAQHPHNSEVRDMSNMSKLASGAAYGVSAGTVANGLLTRLSPDEWSAIGVIAGIVVALLKPHWRRSKPFASGR